MYTCRMTIAVLKDVSPGVTDLPEDGGAFEAVATARYTHANAQAHTHILQYT